MTSKRRQKYLRALRHILVASLIMVSFYLGRWSMNWRLVDLFAATLYVLVVLINFRSELREHRRDSQQFREFLRQCEVMQKSHLHRLEESPLDKAYGYRSYTCLKCGRLSHLPKEVEPYCIECLAESAHL